MVNVTVTGHRPEKISDPGWVKKALAETYHSLEVGRVYQGMASGVDLWAAFVAYRAGIPFVACRPWAGHTARLEDRSSYANALEHAEEIVIVDPMENYPGPWIYDKRNKYMVERSDVVISVWDGSPGGTFNCVQHAKKLGITVYNLNPKTKKGDFLAELTI